jgi:DNA-binding NarL/FixJ family response regulator
MTLRVMEQDRIINIAPREAVAFRVLIVGRDSLTGGMLADALVHNLKCDAVSARQSDLLRVLGMSKVGLVIISADPAAYPRIPMIILMDEPVSDLVIRAFLSGARGVFNPQDSMTEFIDCVEHVRKGSIWAGKAATDYFLEAFRSIPAPGALTEDNSSSLTTRERQVVQCAAMGKTNRAIASELHLSEHTVKNYLFKSFEKLGVSSRVELLFYLTIRGHSFGLPRTEELEDNEAE